ncbi:hypothetical protein PF008_g19636 [Phytophthora fragariae]|uniref:DDE Tnp4 domain-containing protein n=1 Tax=Phytophthora fragariae TaxID=53985 RepID=A0A6G0R236_9STRA|nr:hypothetical protein PF008_g19636 [Phytophthora fragariae]
MEQPDKDDNAAAIVLLHAMLVAGTAVATARLRADNTNELTVTKLDFDKLLTSTRYDAWFCENLRCSQRNFNRIYEVFRPHAAPELLQGREHSFEKKMGFQLLYLASSGSMKEAGLVLGISKPYAVYTINEMLRVVCGQAGDHIRLPSSTEEWRNIMDGFAAVRGFPYVCGAVDGSLFEIARPAEYEGWYCKDYHPAINLQALCDSRRRFMDFDVRPGSYSDKKTWKASKLGASVQNVLPPGAYFLADAGYTLSCELLTPYIPREEGGRLSRCQERYNYTHSATRVAIECAFGMLTQRFRLIRRQLEQKSTTNCTRCILASMILHNILIELEDDTVDCNKRDDPSSMLEMELSTDRRDICRIKRDELASLFHP